jgi:hypothetical protein
VNVEPAMTERYRGATMPSSVISIACRSPAAPSPINTNMHIAAMSLTLLFYHQCIARSKTPKTKIIRSKIKIKKQKPLHLPTASKFSVRKSLPKAKVFSQWSLLNLTLFLISAQITNIKY